MRRPLFILVAFGLATIMAAADVADTTATIRFIGTSTLHGFEGTVVTQPFPATFTEDGASGAIRVTAEAALNVREMTTDHNKRDRNMFKMLDLKNFSLISGSLTDTEIPTTGTGPATLKLKIRDVERDIPVTLSDWTHEGSRACCRMTFEVSLKDFGLKTPSVLGVIRVGDTVQVDCKIEGTCP